MTDSTPTLTDEQQRYQIAAAADHGPETCDCDAYAPENGYPDNLICDALADTFAVVARMVADAEQRGRAEVSAAVEAVLNEWLRTEGVGSLLVVYELRADLTDPAAAVARIKAEALREAAEVELERCTGDWNGETCDDCRASARRLRDRADRIGGQP